MAEIIRLRHPAEDEMRASARMMIICMGGLICLGLVMSYSIPAAQLKTANETLTLQQRTIWLLLGALCFYAASRLNTRVLERNYQLAFYGAILLLALVFVPGLSMKLNGARRWIHLPGGQGQPSELAKWLLVIFVAGYIRRVGPDLLDFRRGFLMPCAWVGAICLMVIIEPDFGTAMLMGAIAIAMLFAGGARVKHLALAAGAGVAGLVFLICHSPERISRVLAFLDPESHGAAAYQQLQSLIALGSGGLFGQGLGGSGRKLAFLPEADSDFVFAIVGEELGFVGAMLVIGLFALLIYHGLRIARLANDPFRSLLAFGITFAIGLQALINLAVVTACAPTKGIALPFISHGGSALVAMMLGVGIVVSVARHRVVKTAFEPASPVIARKRVVAHA